MGALKSMLVRQSSIWEWSNKQYIPYIKNYILKEPGQDSRVGRAWFHLLSQAHQNYNYLQSNYWWERPESSRKDHLQVTMQIRKEGQSSSIVKTHIVRTHTSGGQHTSRMIITAAEVLHREQQVWVPTSGSPASGILHQEDKPPECLALNTSRTYFLETQRATGNRGSTFKEYKQKPHTLWTQGRGSDVKAAWVKPTCWSWRTSQRHRRQLESPWGYKTLAAVIT